MPKNGPTETYQPPPTTTFVPPPPTWNIPGLNFQAPNATAQQPQQPQQPQHPSGWPSDYPTPEQWNQMQFDMQQLPYMMMQNAPIPGLNFISNPSIQTPYQNATPANPLPTPPTIPYPAIQAMQSNQFPLPVSNERFANVMDNDKEEGEVSEGDRVAQSPAVNGRTYPVAPRSVPLDTTDKDKFASVSQQEAYNPNQPAAGQVFQATSRKKTSEPADNRGEAKKFIKLLHNNNIGYHTLAAEDLDASQLRGLYRSLNLPSEPEPVPSLPTHNGNAQPHFSNGEGVAAHPVALATNGLKPTTIVNTSVPPAPPNKSVPSPAGDRKEYIARLQAAKMAKNAGMKVTPPRKTPPPASTVAKPASTLGLPAAGDNVDQPTEAQKKARMTELIRQRIESLKKNSSSPAAPPTVKLPTTGPAPSVSSVSRPEGIQQMSSPTQNISTPRTTSPSPFSHIPGLFMTFPPIAQPSQAPTTPGLTNRKRTLPTDGPLADYASRSQVALDSERKVTAASDTQPVDEMDVDDSNVGLASMTPSVPVQNGFESAQGLSMTTALPSVPTSVNPSVSAVSTPGPQTPSSIARSQELEDKERKMAALKERLQKKMEAMEEQKRQAHQSAAAVMSPFKASTNKQSLSSHSVSTSVQASPVQIMHQNVTGFTPIVTQELVRAPKRQRKAEIEAQIPALDAEIAENAAKLAQLTKEMQLLTANDAKMRHDKEQLQEELESLGIDTEGMPHAELQAKKAEIVREQEEALGNRLTRPNFPTTVHSSAMTAEPAREENFRAIEGANHDLSHLPEEANSVTRTSIPGINPSFSLPSTPSSATKPHSVTDQETANQPGKRVPLKGTNSSMSSGPIPAPRGLTKSTTPVDDEEDFYSPEPATIVSKTDQFDVASKPLVDASSPSEEGEVAMSESDEEDYEPEEPQAYAQTQVLEATEQSNIIMKSPASSVKSSTASPVHEDEDVYEPPDVDQTMLDSQSNMPAATGSEPNALRGGEIEEGEMDISSSSEDESGSDATSESADEDESKEPTSGPSSKQAVSSLNITDDLAPELQPQASAVASVIQESDATSYDENEARMFVPYESPLKLFKSFRYHPNYPQDVPGGFLSMTFSHQIDPDIPLCATEALGATCEKLLVQLGTANPGKTQEERQRWNDGLRGVLKDLRQKNTKDPNGIAMEIANYRRQFLKDDTRVVNL
ncbi:hypothetical protein N0V90_010786 [Kalmusia sp. IMI 367209]|nr:hypothetical protein N0V90_010786 [Kalmusia sp. IMI 367209]